MNVPRRPAAERTGTPEEDGRVTGPGSCWCHGQHGITIPADDMDGLCSACRGRSPSACGKAHAKEAATGEGGRAVPGGVPGAEPYWADETVALYGGDALAVLASLPDASVDAVITDPPYSSGGQFRSDRAGDVHTKYVNNDSGTGNDLAAFGGDNRDQRAYGYWCTLWLGECLRVTKRGGVCLLFTDWRQLPMTTDALQAGGWVWRGIVPWVKPGARPQAGRFTAACEYVVWGSAGPMTLELGDVCLPGFYQALAPRDREHIAQKPLSVMRSLVKIAPKGGTVLDPFMGAGTTGVAAVNEGRQFIGVEWTAHFQQVARERIVAAQVGYRDDGKQMALTDPAA